MDLTHEMTHEAEERGISPRKAMILSLGVGVVVFGLKYAAYLLTGSVSLYSDALESVVNVVAAGAALVAVWIAARPPDENHPFGHNKAEYFSAVLEGGLILFAAVEIVRAAWDRFLDPIPLTALGVGLALSVGATALNAGLARFLVWNGRQRHSPALVADGRHLWTDVITTLGVLAGVGLAGLTGWWILDPLIAIGVAVNIVRVGVGIIRESLGGLMDEVLPEEQMQTLEAIIADHMGEALEVHDLRARRAAQRTFIEFHLVVPSTMRVRVAHRISDQIEEALHREVPGAEIIVHVEPEKEAEHEGLVTRIGTNS